MAESYKIVKHCSKHGFLQESDCYGPFAAQRSGKVYISYDCKVCTRVKVKRYKIKNQIIGESLCYQ
jgi:hypothetical protein